MRQLFPVVTKRSNCLIFKFKPTHQCSYYYQSRHRFHRRGAPNSSTSSFFKSVDVGGLRFQAKVSNIQKLRISTNQTFDKHRTKRTISRYICSCLQYINTSTTNVKTIRPISEIRWALCSGHVTLCDPRFWSHVTPACRQSSNYWKLRTELGLELL